MNRANYQISSICFMWLCRFPLKSIDCHYWSEEASYTLSMYIVDEPMIDSQMSQSDGY